MEDCDNSVDLHTYIDSRLDESDLRYEQRFAGFDHRLEALSGRLTEQLREKDLRDQQRFDAQGEALQAALTAAEKAVATALLSAEKAVTKAEIATEKRFESVNEFREALSDNTKNFIGRFEHEALETQVTNLASRIDHFEGKGSGTSSSWTILLGAVGLIASLVAIAVVIYGLQ